MDNPLSIVQEFATSAHTGQVRKFEDAPYIVHPVRVMEICKEYTTDTTILSAALLHDVLEDTTVTKKELYDFLLSVFPVRATDIVIELVDGMTDQYTRKAYPSWNRRKRKQSEIERLVRCNSNVHTIKYADIIDNCLSVINSRDFAQIYLLECRSLLKRIDKGNKELYKRAVQTIEQLLVNPKIAGKTGRQ
jgi:guanosine-3',5'-bis(diphosphate) 3'-pyrophosphohydrolase